MNLWKADIKKSQCFDQNIIVHCKNNQESLNIFKTNQLFFFFERIIEY